MQSGTLDRLVTIQRSTQTQSLSGHPTDAWSSIGALRRPASLRILSGDERFNDPQWVAKEQVEFKIRYAASVADLTPLDRIIYPAMTTEELNASPQPAIAESRIYDVMAVGELGRREGLSIKASRRADVTS